jgi:hypothetical protein
MNNVVVVVVVLARRDVMGANPSTENIHTDKEAQLTATKRKVLGVILNEVIFARSRLPTSLQVYSLFEPERSPGFPDLRYDGESIL